MRAGRSVLLFVFSLPSLFLLAAPSSFGQTAKRFVKVEPHQCWDDVKDVVRRRAFNITTNETYHTLTAERFASMEGDLSIIVAVVSDQNKKGEAGCSIIVAVSGSASLASSGQKINALNGSGNFRTAAFIASEVESLQKARDKKARTKNP
jgi:hypothetical protein